jgi:hypothetical protein
MVLARCLCASVIVPEAVARYEACPPRSHIACRTGEHRKCIAQVRDFITCRCFSALIARTALFPAVPSRFARQFTFARSRAALRLGRAWSEVCESDPQTRGFEVFWCWSASGVCRELRSVGHLPTIASLAAWPWEKS